MNAEVTIAILTFIAFSIPIVGALWKIFALRESLQSEIRDNRYRIAAMELHFENFRDQHLTSYKGLQDLTEHIRQRTRKDDEEINERILDLECYLEKSTSFQRRRGFPKN